MGFKDFTKKIVEFKNKTIAKASSSLANSSIVIKDLKELKEAINKSQNTKFTSKETWETKTFTKHSIIIFTWKDVEVYKDFLFSIHFLRTKAWSKNTHFRLCNLEKKDLVKYEIKEFPSLALFTNKRLKKVIYWEKNIDKIINSLNFNVVEVIKKIEIEEQNEKSKKPTTKKTTTRQPTTRKPTTKKTTK